MRVVEAITGVNIAQGTTLYAAVASAFLAALVDHRFATWNDVSMAVFLDHVLAAAELEATAVKTVAPSAVVIPVLKGKAATLLSELLGKRCALPTLRGLSRASSLPDHSVAGA